MSRNELVERARQSLTARLDVLRYGTGTNLAEGRKPEAVATGHFFFSPKDIPGLCVLLREVLPAEVEKIKSDAEKICRHRFDLLGYSDLDYGKEIDWHRDAVHEKRGPRVPWFKVPYLNFNTVGDAKVTWELNRHQHFVTLAKAYRLTDEEKFAQEIFSQWTHWHQQNPYPIGMNWASSLEVGYRCLSWIWTYFLLEDSPLFTDEIKAQWCGGLEGSGRHIETFLSTYFSPNTHLLGEALALFFLGTLFRGSPAAKRWQQQGWSILQSGAEKQVRPDGFYFEQSTYYHVYALDIFLHARILASLNHVEVPPAFDQTVQRMLTALMLLGRAGIAPSFGDDDGGRIFDPRRNRAEHLLDPLAMGAALYGRGDFKFVTNGPREEALWLLGANGLAEFDRLPSSRPNAESTSLPDAGFYMMVAEDARQQLVIDAGPLGEGQGGHGHADALSICLVSGSDFLLHDPGTGEYVGTGNERARLRGTSAHNTLQVDGCDQAEGAPPFSWKDHPRTEVRQWVTGRQFDFFEGHHDGYSRLPSPVLHRRWVFHRKNEFWLVRDLAEGRGKHKLQISWHFGRPSAAPSAEQSTHSNQGLQLLTPNDDRWQRREESESWSSAYGRLEQGTRVYFAAETSLPADFATLLTAENENQSESGHLTRLAAPSADPVSGFSYTKGTQEHRFFFSQQPWSLASWSSDAEFLYWSWDPETEESMLVLCNGSYADYSGNRVLSCTGRVRYAEIFSSRSQTENSSPDSEQIVLERPLQEIWAREASVTSGRSREGTSS